MEVRNLVNHWILNELALCQKNYFYHLEKKEINFATAQLIKFTREKLSNEYLELIKISPWDTKTKNTFLFVYQQLLIMFHPVVPFITEHIYQEITHQEILNGKFERIDLKTENNHLWQVDCLLLLISNLRNFRPKSKVSEFYLELISEWKEKLDTSFDFNQYLEPLTKSKIHLLEKGREKEFSSFLNLPPFGILWYQEKIDKKELEAQLKLYEAEFQRSQRLLTNHDFLKKAPPHLVAEEQKKLTYYQEQKEKVQTELKKIKN